MSDREFANRAITGCILLEFVIQEAKQNLTSEVELSTLEHIMNIVNGEKENEYTL